MRDDEGVRFLQWALPRLGMRWSGFRRVRRQVLRRIDRRVVELGLSGIEAYRSRLADDAAEWTVLDRFCRVTITRFYRDRPLWDRLVSETLVALADSPSSAPGGRLRVWSAGCASGEEPYTLALAWKLAVSARVSGVEMQIVATDSDPHLLERARAATYEPGCLRDLPPGWRERAFRPCEGGWLLAPELREGIALIVQDIRQQAPAGKFGLVLCRNLPLTYFDESHQRDVLRRIGSVLEPDGLLVIGRRETLPPGCGFEADAGTMLFRQIPDKTARR